MDSRQLKTHWSKICDQLKADIGESAFENWLKPMAIIEVRGSEVLCSVPSRFMRDWILANYIERLKVLWNDEVASIQSVSLVIQTKPNLTPQDREDESSFIVDGAKGKVKQSGISGDKESKGEIAAPLDPKFTFDQFVVGKPNEFAYAAARRVAEAATVPFNPLFLYGGVGLGKTHLMNAIAWEILERDPSRTIMYLSAEKFMYRFVRALREQNTVDFKEQFRSVDVLMIDDVQFIGGRDATQEEFFHTFNALLDRNNQMVLTCDKYPKEIDGLEERLKSRLGWGLPVVIDPPELETRAAVLLSKSVSMGISMPDDCAIYIAQRIRSNIRELEGALKRVVANARFTNQEVDLALVKDALKDLFVISAKMVSIENIQKTVAEYYNIKLSDLLSKRRSRSITRPRQMAMALTKELTNHSLPEIGEAFNGRDHTTVLHACKKILELRKESASHEEDYRNLNRALTN